jgi:hypothetical protein
VRKTQTQRFGGVTAFTHAPAHGVTTDSGTPAHDDIIIMQVMADTPERDVWARYRKHLETEFVQDEIVIRASFIEKL